MWSFTTLPSQLSRSSINATDLFGCEGRRALWKCLGNHGNPPQLPFPAPSELTRGPGIVDVLSSDQEMEHPEAGPKLLRDASALKAFLKRSEAPGGPNL